MEKMVITKKGLIVTRKFAKKTINGFIITKNNNLNFNGLETGLNQAQIDNIKKCKDEVVLARMCKKYFYGLKKLPENYNMTNI